MKRGDVYWVELSPRSGSEQTGRRPAIVISRDTFNTAPHWKSIIVLPMSTSENQLKRGPTAVHLAKGEADLNKECIVLCHQVTTLDRSKLVQYVGTLSPTALKQVEEGLKVALGMLDKPSSIINPF